MRTSEAIAHAAGAILIAMGLDRLVLALAILVAVTVLAFTGKVESEAAIGIYAAFVGYLVGAGHEAVKSSSSEG